MTSAGQLEKVSGITKHSSIHIYPPRTKNFKDQNNNNAKDS